MEDNRGSQNMQISPTGRNSLGRGRGRRNNVTPDPSDMEQLVIQLESQTLEQEEGSIKVVVERQYEDHKEDEQPQEMGKKEKQQVNCVDNAQSPSNNKENIRPADDRERRKAEVLNQKNEQQENEVSFYIKVRDASHFWKPTFAERRDLSPPVIRTSRHKEPIYPRNLGNLNLSSNEQRTVNLMKDNQWMLNKLNMRNLGRELNRFLRKIQYENCDDERMTTVINQIAERAINEPMYAEVYANFVDLVIQSASIKVAKKLKQEVLAYCRKEFKYSYTNEINEAKNNIEAEEDSVKKEELKEKLKEKMLKIQRKTLGNVKFIGFLFNLHHLTSNEALTCVKKLLADVDNVRYVYLCEFLMIVGPTLDDKTHDLTEQAKAMNSVFFQMKRLAMMPKNLIPKARIAFKDVVELRERDWKKFEDDEDEGSSESLQEDSVVTKPRAAKLRECDINDNWRAGSAPLSPPKKEKTDINWSSVRTPTEDPTGRGRAAVAAQPSNQQDFGRLPFFGVARGRGRVVSPPNCQ